MFPIARITIGPLAINNQAKPPNNATITKSLKSRRIKAIMTKMMIPIKSSEPPCWETHCYNPEKFIVCTPLLIN